MRGRWWRRTQDRQQLQVTRRFGRMLVQATNCLPRATSPSRPPARPNPGDLQIRTPLPSPRPLRLLILFLPQPRCYQPRCPIHYMLDAVLPSCVVLVVCLFNVPTVIVNTLFSIPSHSRQFPHAFLLMCSMLALAIATCQPTPCLLLYIYLLLLLLAVISNAISSSGNW